MTLSSNSKGSMNESVDGSVSSADDEYSEEDCGGSISNVEGEENEEVSGNESSSSDNLNERDRKINHNPGWADAMAKVLKMNKPKRKKTIVLAKAKKLKPVSKEGDGEDPLPFEIEGAADEEQEVKVKVESTVKQEKKLSKLEYEKKIRKLFLEKKGRVKPSIIDKDREKVLNRVATKGVVQLFNAVRQQQKSLEKEIEKAGPLETRQEKVLQSVDKRAFLDVLMGAKSEAVPDVKQEEPTSNEWSVLRNDFMMSSKFKDWDKEEENVKIK